MANPTENKLKTIFRILPALGIVLLLVGFGLSIGRARFDAVAYGSIGLGLLLFLTLFVKAEVANLKYYLNVFVYSFVVFGICVLAYLFAQQYTQKVDLTEQKLFSLSAESTKYLKRLDKDVTITVFAETPDPFRDIQALYKDATDRVKWRVLDARTNPTEALKFGDTVRNGDIYVVAGGKAQGTEKKKRLLVSELQNNYENVLTNAIVEVTRAKSIKIYFLTGHGEVAYERAAAPSSRERGGAPSLGAFRDFLTQRAIDTDQLDLGKTGAVPEDATLLIIAGPQDDLLPTEVTALRSYLEKRGKLLVLLDVPQRNVTAVFSNLADLLKYYGVGFSNRIIMDLAGVQLTKSPVKPLAAWFDPNHPITRDLGNRASRFILSLTRPLVVGKPISPDVTVTELIRSSDKSWSEDIATVLASERLTPPPASGMQAQTIGLAVSQDAARPMPGMAINPNAKGGMRLVVFGSSELIQDSFLTTYQTAAELMLNTVNWLSEQEDMIAAPPRQLKGTPIVLDGAQLRVIFGLVVILIPGGLFFGGVSYSLLRRRR